MKNSFKTAMKDPLIKDMIKVLAVAAAVVLAFIGIKTLRNYFKK